MVYAKTTVRMIVTLIVVSVPALGLLGCQNHDKVETQEPQEKVATTAEKFDLQLDRQSENADLTDMVLCDIHFLPRRPILNGTGTVRLNRLAWLVDRYGGKIMLDFEETESELADARMKTVKAYLKACGLTEGVAQVAFGLPETKGMHANEAIVIYEESRTKMDEDTGSLSGIGTK